jgi:glycosyltransferase involved in cell wall biosynthesis
MRGPAGTWIEARMKPTTNVAILLSTMNGAPYLGEQLDSLLAQSHADWQLYWRDDGSDDTTPMMMRSFADGAGAGRVVDLNDNAGLVGIMARFLALLRRAPRGQIVAFADQDDVWLPDKLARGVAALNEVPAHLPGLYCSRQTLVAADLSPIRISDPIRRPAGFPESMTQNIATGCTVMLNPEAATLMAGAREPEATLHDWWSYVLVTASGGRVLFDDVPTILYRQHARNAVGVPPSLPRRAWAALQRGPRAFMRIFRAHMAALQAQEELLSPPAREAMQRISAGLQGGWRQRAHALAHPGLKRQSWAETQLFRLWFLLG